MGLTIHYKLHSTVRSPKDARQLVEQLRQRARDLPFKTVGKVVELSGAACNYRTHSGNSALRWLAVQAAQYVERDRIHYPVTPTHVIAFDTEPGDGCEAANFGLCTYPGSLNIPDPRTGRNSRLETGLAGWRWSSFCKTQYASDPSVGGVENFLRCHLCVIGLLDRAKELGILAGVNDEGDFWEKRDMKALAQQVGEWNANMAAMVGQFKDLFGDQIIAPITEYPDFEHLEAKGRRGKKPPTS